MTVEIGDCSWTISQYFSPGKRKKKIIFFWPPVTHNLTFPLLVQVHVTSVLFLFPEKRVHTLLVPGCFLHSRASEDWPRWSLSGAHSWPSPSFCFFLSIWSPLGHLLIISMHRKLGSGCGYCSSFGGSVHYSCWCHLKPEICCLSDASWG